LKWEVFFGLRADADLISLYNSVAARSGRRQASRYVDRLRTFCLSLNTFPERGHQHDRIRPGVRVVGFERRVSIAFRMKLESVTIPRVLYGGRDLPKSLRRKD
jgi:toxin ParE1/3/4